MSSEYRSVRMRRLAEDRVGLWRDGGGIGEAIAAVREQVHEGRDYPVPPRIGISVTLVKSRSWVMSADELV